MPIKFNKNVSAQLFRFVKSVDIKFNPFDGRAKSAKEMWRQMKASRFYKANPKLKLNTHVLGGPDAPEVLFTLVDDTEKRFDSQQWNADEMLFDVHLTLDRLDSEFEMAGKSLDD